VGLFWEKHNRLYCYADLNNSSLAVLTAIIAYPLSNGQAESA